MTPAEISIRSHVREVEVLRPGIGVFNEGESVVVFIGVGALEDNSVRVAGGVVLRGGGRDEIPLCLEKGAEATIRPRGGGGDEYKVRNK